ncbi:hypothetical protein [Mongoliitalea daihaiensis]|uniref:hypothetical protein n=1 Tax=Mongoliitalea daihaiensis TaxID=2782006 RepID=UPI001F452DD2|nr:hypothetical protein [Mongoliitalea daihaiensis]
MKRFLLLLFICSGLISNSYAQRYGTAVGLRLGSNDFSRTVGISANQRILRHTTLEGILQSDFSRNTTSHLLIKNHKPLISKRFNYYYGGGFSFGHEESFVKNRASKEIIHTYGNPTSGIDLVVGVEATVLSTVISLDYKPNFNMAGREEFVRGQVGVSARWVLVTGKEQDKKWRQKKRVKRKAAREPLGDRIKNVFKKN